MYRTALLTGRISELTGDTCEAAKNKGQVACPKLISGYIGADFISVTPVTFPL